MILGCYVLSARLPRPEPNSPPTTGLGGTRTSCCDHQTMSVGADDIPYWQAITFGTTAHTRTMGRRELIEKVNSQLKGGICNLDRKFMRVFLYRRAVAYVGLHLGCIQCGVCQVLRCQTSDGFRFVTPAPGAATAKDRNMDRSAREPGSR